MTDLDDATAWIGRLGCGCVTAAHCGDEDDARDFFAEDPDIVTVEKTTVGAARQQLMCEHGRPVCEVIAERDQARDIAKALEREHALKDEALAELRTLHSEHVDGGWCAGCGVNWPCDTVRILAALAARLSARLHGDEVCSSCGASLDRQDARPARTDDPATRQAADVRQILAATRKEKPMSDELRDRALSTLRTIRADIKQDVAAMERAPFDGRTVGTHMGYLAAQVDALAGILIALLKDGADE